MTFYGIGKISSIYYITSIITSFTLTSGRRIPPEVAKAVLPATVLGYVLPSIAAALPFTTTSTISRRLAALIRLAPLSVSVLTTIISAAIRKLDRHRGPRAGKTPSQDEQEAEAVRDTYRTTDAVPLRTAYTVFFIAQAAHHILAAGRIALTSGATSCVAAVLGGEGAGPAGIAHSMARSPYLRSDLALYAGATLTYGLYTVWDLRRRGYATGRETRKAALGVVAGQVLVGPGATLVGLWWWREGVLAGLVHPEGVSY